MSVNRLTGVNSAATILFKRTPRDADTYHVLPTFWRDVDHEEHFCWSVSVLSTSFTMPEEQRTLVLSPEDLQAIITGVASSPALISGIADHLHSRNLIPPRQAAIALG